MIYAVAGLGTGTLCGWLGAYYYHFRTSDSDLVQKYMSRVVNIEQLEEHEKLVKLRMMRNKLKTTRVDGGPNARVMRMRLRPRMKRS